MNKSAKFMHKKAEKFIYRLEDEIYKQPVLCGVLACLAKTTYDIYRSEDKMLHNKSFMGEFITEMNRSSNAPPFSFVNSLEDKSFLPILAIGGAIGFFSAKLISRRKSETTNNVARKS